MLLVYHSKERGRFSVFPTKLHFFSSILVVKMSQQEFPPCFILLLPSAVHCC